MNVWRRLGGTGVLTLAGILLLTAGVAMTVVESQVRIDAATASVALTPAQRAQLRDVGIDEVEQDSYRDWLIVRSMTSGGPVPTLVLEVGDDEDSGSWSWGPAEGFGVESMGGWQPKPLTMVPAAGLGLLLGALFLAAARWRPRASNASN